MTRTHDDQCATPTALVGACSSPAGRGTANACPSRWRHTGVGHTTPELAPAELRADKSRLEPGAATSAKRARLAWLDAESPLEDIRLLELVERVAARGRRAGGRSGDGREGAAVSRECT